MVPNVGTGSPHRSTSRPILLDVGSQALRQSWFEQDGVQIVVAEITPRKISAAPAAAP